MDSNLIAVFFVIVIAFLVSVSLFFIQKRLIKLQTQILFIIGLYVFSLVFLNLSLEDLGVTHIGSGLLWGALVSLVAIVILYASSKHPKSKDFFRDGRTKSLSNKHIVYRIFVDIPIGTVLFEELLFRGLLFGFISTIYGTSEAVLFSSVFFGLWHVVPSITFSRHNGKAPATLPTVIGTVIFTGCSGIVFALLRVMSGSIIAPIALHYAVNTASLILSWLHNAKDKE